MAPISGLLSSAGHLAERLVLEPTRTTVTDALFRRQTSTGATATVTVIQTAAAGSGNGNSTQTMDGGAIAGIVIGSIVGILLLIWIFRSFSNMGAPPVKGENPSGQAWYDGVQAEPYPSSPRRSHHSRHRSRSHRRPSSEVREYTTTVPVVAQPVAPQPTYVYETDERRARRGRSRDHRSSSRY